MKTLLLLFATIFVAAASEVPVKKVVETQVSYHADPHQDTPHYYAKRTLYYGQYNGEEELL